MSHHQKSLHIYWTRFDKPYHTTYKICKQLYGEPNTVQLLFSLKIQKTSILLFCSFLYANANLLVLSMNIVFCYCFICYPSVFPNLTYAFFKLATHQLDFFRFDHLIQILF